MFDKLMADYGLTDVFRQLEGKHARSYTRLGSTVHTRIDCVFGPQKSDKYQWYSYSTSEMFGSTWKSDHLAITVELKKVDGPLRFLLIHKEGILCLDHQRLHEAFITSSPSSHGAGASDQ